MLTLSRVYFVSVLYIRLCLPPGDEIKFIKKDTYIKHYRINKLVQLRSNFTKVEYRLAMKANLSILKKCHIAVINDSFESVFYLVS